MSGSTPSRVMSTFRLGFVLPSTRSMPVCCQQNPPTAGPVPVGLVPAGQVAASIFTGLDTKIWELTEVLVTPFFAVSSHVTHGPGAAPAVVLPPATDGSAAFCVVSMLRLGGMLGRIGPRVCPAKTHLSCAWSKRLAKSLLNPPRGEGCSLPADR